MARWVLVLWSLDTIDWKNPPAATLERRIVGRAKAGDIVLMHPTAPTAESLPAMIQGVRAKGLKLVTLNALLASERTAAGSNGAQGEALGADPPPRTGAAPAPGEVG